MKRIDYEFKIDGFCDFVNYYRLEQPIDLNNKPPATVTEISGTSYSDTSAEEEKTYYVSFGSVKGTTEKMSEEIVVSTVTVFHPIFSNVVGFVLADATSLPSSSLIDKTSNATFNSSDKPTQVAMPSFATGAAFRLSSNNMRIEMKSPQYAFSNFDFVVESEVLLSETAVNTGAWDLIAIGSTYGISGRAVGLDIRYGEVRVTTRPELSTGYDVQYPTGKILLANQKYHLAIMRRNNVFYFFLDGILIYTLSEIINLTVGTITFGRYAGSETRYFNSIRISKEAFYPISGFTPPSLYPIP